MKNSHSIVKKTKNKANADFLLSLFDCCSFDYIISFWLEAGSENVSAASTELFISQ